MTPKEKAEVKEILCRIERYIRAFAMVVVNEVHDPFSPEYKAHLKQVDVEREALINAIDKITGG